LEQRAAILLRTAVGFSREEVGHALEVTRLRRESCSSTRAWPSPRPPPSLASNPRMQVTNVIA
jgi:hypothetical protein